MFQGAAHPTSAIPDSYPAATRAWYMLGVLLIANVLSFVDRQILVLLVQPIRHDLGISDIRISLLQGFAFTILYSILGLPLGRYADSGNRRNLIIFGVSIWSVMTVMCGFAQSYSELFMARIGVGIGEAALAPAAYSMICDVFHPQRRGAALGVYSSGIYLGIGVSVALGGAVLAFIHGAAEVTLPLVGVVRSWQAAFICVGVPGLAVALLMLTVKEPARRADCMSGKNNHSLTEAWRYLVNHRSLFSRQILGYTCLAAAAYGTGSWVPSYLIRIHHMSPSKAGITYGVAVSVLGTVGGVIGGLLGDRWLAAKRSDARILISVISCLFWIPCIIAGTQTGTPMTVVVMMGAASCFSSACNGLGPTTLQDMVPGWLRGQATALFFFVINLIGLGIGPTSVALATDLLFGYDAAVRFSIPLVVIPLILLGASLLLGVRKQYREARESLV